LAKSNFSQKTVGLKQPLLIAVAIAAVTMPFHSFLFTTITAEPYARRQDAQLILRLMLKDDFPQIWVPSWENRDLRQLLWHRHRMVQARTRMMNQLQAVAFLRTGKQADR
jgi:hypothetical protein